MVGRAKRALEPNRDDQILRTAARLFAAKGFDAASVNDLANAVGLSKATIYHYFDDKDQVYTEIVVKTLERLCKHVELAVEQKQTAKEKVLAFAEAQAGFFEANREACIVETIGFGGMTRRKERQKALVWRDRHERNLRKIIAEGIAAGEFRPLDPRLSAIAILSCLAWMVKWYRPGGSLTAVAVARTHMDILLNGMLS